MTTLLMLIAVLWFGRRILLRFVVRLAIFAIGFRIGWKFLDRS